MPEDYSESFMKAVAVFLYARIYDAKTKSLKSMKPLDQKYLQVLNEDLDLLGANVGQHCSIRAINAITDPRLISIGDGVHLGDFSQIVSGFYSSDGFSFEEISVQRNSILRSQSLVLPGSTIQEDVILGAFSIAPMNSILLRGGVYIGSQAPIMVKNNLHASDERIEEMDDKYKKLVGNLAGNLAITTMKLNSRYFHRIGVGGKDILKMYSNSIPDNEMLVYVG